jgi:hypothetical protein
VRVFRGNVTRGRIERDMFLVFILCVREYTWVYLGFGLREDKEEPVHLLGLLK